MGKELAISNTEQGTFDFGREDAGTVSGAVIEAVASTAGEDPLEIEPLHSVVDPDALEAIFGQKLNGVERDGDISVTFALHGYEVTLWSYGRIHVSEPSSESPLE